MSNNTSKSHGIGFCGLLTILFIGLKLTHNIEWSWWYVLMPTWLPIGIMLGIAAIALVLAIILAMFE